MLDTVMCANFTIPYLDDVYIGMLLQPIFDNTLRNMSLEAPYLRFFQAVGQNMF